MKKYFMYIILALIIILIIAFAIFGTNNKSSTGNSTSATKLSTNPSTNTTLEQAPRTNQLITETHLARHDVEEQELASFSTKLSGNDTPRTRNIGITSSKLNGTTLNNGETFSFCETIGNPTAELGYEEADSFDEHGKTVKTYGGGNCQVSSTLYNVVLQISDLEVVERHAHIKPVHYVEEDKDATVAYGSVDFKFKNNTGNTIKIYANSDLNGVNIRIVKLGT